MKKYIVPLLLGLLVAVASVTLRKGVAKAATPRATLQTACVNTLGVLASTRNTLPTIGFGPGPSPCPPSCLKLTGK